MGHIYHIDDDVLHQFQGPQGRDIVEPVTSTQSSHSCL
jgi:hypothetical protein